MKSILFISRASNNRFGGMQAYTKELLHGFSQYPDIAISTCLFSGSRFLLPFFFFRALTAVLVTHADTVLVGDGVLSPLLFVLKIFRPQKKRVIIVYGLDLTWTFFGYRTIVRYALRFADTIVAISRFTADLVGSFGITHPQIHVIPCPVSLPPMLRRVRRPEQILFLGRLIERKGIAWFLESVFPLLLFRLPALKLVIAGDGPLRTRIEAVVSSYSFSDQVLLLGNVREDEKWELLAESALLIVPNIHLEGDPEGFGIVCLEAAASGLPVVAACTDGLTDAVEEGVTGSFFTAGSEEACVRATQHVLQKRWDRDRMKAVTIDRFSAHSIATRFYHGVF